MTSCYDCFNEVIEPTPTVVLDEKVLSLIQCTFNLPNHPAIFGTTAFTLESRNRTGPDGVRLEIVIITAHRRILHTTVKTTLRTYSRVPPGEGSTLVQCHAVSDKNSAHSRILHEETQT